MKTYLIAGVSAIALAGPVNADEFTPAMESYFRDNIESWANDSVLVDAITAQNSDTVAYDQSQIDALDTAWRAEVGTSSTPTITPVLTSDAADFLRDQVEASGGQITEVFIMDARGLNVAASDVTSDYWQGDEAKHQKTHGMGAGAVHISDVEFDESAQSYQGQISVTIVDSAGAPIGAMTVGVDAASLM